MRSIRCAKASAGLAARLVDYCRPELATYKCPRTVDFVDELPRDPNGKLYKRLLRDVLDRPRITRHLTARRMSPTRWP
ncbi:MAG: AMP-binding enzyme [Mycobacterium sp.]